MNRVNYMSVDPLLSEFFEKKHSLVKKNRLNTYLKEALHNDPHTKTYDNIDDDILSKNTNNHINTAVDNNHRKEIDSPVNTINSTKKPLSSNNTEVVSIKINELYPTTILPNPSNIISSNNDNLSINNTNPELIIKSSKSNTPLINIITRTSKRPNYFLECYHSIVCQTYSNIRHIIGFDNYKSLDYIIRNKPNKNNVFYTHSNEIRINPAHMPYNLYLNILMNQVTEGWIMFLDDDDILNDINSINTIVSHIENNDQLLIWKVKKLGKTIPNKSFKKKPISGDITSNSFLFHSKYISIAQWDNKSAGDFRVVNKLFNYPNINTIWIDNVLAKVNNLDGMGRGKQIDKRIEKPIIENIYKMNISYSLYRNKNNIDWLHDIFDKVYLLNLDRRKDRYQKMKDRFNYFDIKHFSRFSAIDGSEFIYKNQYLQYQLSNKNKGVGKNIPSSGSWAILLSMKNLILDAIRFQYKNILIFQDDLIFIKDFKRKFITMFNHISHLEWKLLYLGVSNHYWNKFKPNINKNSIVYHPNGYCDGAFAVAINHSIFPELLIEIDKMTLPFDSGPLKTIQQRYKDKCFVFYPNLVIADVTNSDCRAGRNQNQLSNKFGWDLSLYSTNIPHKKTNTINSLVSIIITCFNSSKYIYSSVSSIINQTYSNIEIIIIDDNSTDNTLSIINNMKMLDNRIIVLKNDINYGTYISKNIGILHSKGDYICFHDSDDYSISNRIYKQLEFMSKNNSYSGCNCCFFSRSKNKKNELSPAEITLFIKKSVYQKIGFFDSVRVGGDTEFRRRLQLAGLKIHTINEYLYSCLDRFMECNNTGKKTSLTSSKTLGVNSNIRTAYRNSFQEYHQTINKNTIYMPFPLIRRLFSIKYDNTNDKKLMESKLTSRMIEYLSNISLDN